MERLLDVGGIGTYSDFHLVQIEGIDYCFQA